MDCQKVGKLIFDLRKERNMTQKEVADAMNISDKTISKWERGLGLPDVSLLGELSKIFSVNIEKILSGNLDPNDSDGGNMKKIKFYVCNNCGNIINSTGVAAVSCCGRKLEALAAKPCNNMHSIKTEEVEDDYYITIQHEMRKEHYISFFAYIMHDRVLIIRLYPEQNAELRFQKMYGRKMCFYCNQHGLWVNENG